MNIPPLLQDWNPDPNSSYPLDHFPVEIQKMFTDKEKLQQDYLQKIEQRQQLITLPDILHHYTNVFGLKGIAFEEEIWFNDYRTTNDPTEGSYARTLIENKFKDKFSFLIREDNIDEHTQLVINSLHDRNFIACFTENSDQLSQWIHYGGSAAGYCIGIDRHELESQHIQVKDRVESIKIFPIIYDKTQQDIGIGGFLALIDNFYNQYHPILSINSHAIKYLESVIYDFEKWMANFYALRYKDEAFEDEKEWRCVISINNTYFYNTPLRVRDNSLVSYIPVKVSVRSIKSGPKASHEHLHYAWGARAVVNHAKKLVQISDSNIPFR